MQRSSYLVYRVLIVYMEIKDSTKTFKYNNLSIAGFVLWVGPIIFLLKTLFF